MTNPDRIASSWIARMSQVVDPTLRVASLRSELVAFEEALVADVFHAVTEGADAGLADFRHLLLLASVAIAQPELEPKKRLAGRLARDRGLFAAAELLLPAPKAKPVDEDAPAPGTIPRAPGRALTLGERKSLARRVHRPVLERVLLDPSADVIRILLGNPSLTEADVVRVSARRPVAPEVLREVFLSTRWVLRYGVRLALVKNPSLDTDLGLALVRQLTRQDAEAVSSSTELPLSVRETAMREARRLPLH